MIANNIHFKLEIEVEAVGPVNTFGIVVKKIIYPGAYVKNISLSPMKLWNSESNDFYLPDKEFLNSIAYNYNHIVIKSEKLSKIYVASNNEYFTYQDIYDIVLDFEKKNRINSTWLGGIDIYHVFFEGLHQNKDKTFSIFWGS